jgi:hypothetical protein
MEAANKKYVDDKVSQVPTNVMTTDIYDINTNGIVDNSEDTQKLGGELPSFYATKTEVQDKISRGGDIMNGSLVIKGGLNVEATSELYDAILRKSLIKSYSNKAKIEFEDVNYPTSSPGIFWDSTDQTMKIQSYTSNSYNIWHSGNFNPDLLNPMNRKTFIGDGVTTTFNVGMYTPNNADVYYNGVRLFEPEDVDISSGTEIVFTEAPEQDDRIDFVGYTNSLI